MFHDTIVIKLALTTPSPLRLLAQYFFGVAFGGVRLAGINIYNSIYSIRSTNLLRPIFIVDKLTPSG